MIQKRILVPARLRRPPETGWSWVDRRFVRERMAHLSREAALLRMTLPALVQAREELLAHDLIAHEVRFTQVLSLPPPSGRLRSESGQGLIELGELLRRATALPHSREGSNSP